MTVSASLEGVPAYRTGRITSSESQIVTNVFSLSSRAYLMLFITRGRGWSRFLLRNGVRVLLVSAVIGYLAESWRTSGLALLTLGVVAAVALVSSVIGGWLMIRRAARRGDCVRFEQVYYAMDERTLTLYWAGGHRSTAPLIRVQRVVRTPRYCLLHMERGLFHCVPVKAFKSGEDLRRCEEWFLAAEVPVLHMK